MNLGRRIRSRDTLRHDHTGAYTRWDHRLLAHPVQVWRFLILLQRFRRHVRRFKANSLTMSQSEAIADITRHYVSPGLHGTAFLPLDRLTGFTMLLGPLPGEQLDGEPRQSETADAFNPSGDPSATDAQRVAPTPFFAGCIPCG